MSAAVPAPRHLTEDLARKLKAKWGEDLGVHYLIVDSDHYAVFLDGHLDVDWIAKDEHGRGPNGPSEEEKKSFGSVANEVGLLQAVPIGHHPADLRLSFRRLLGEAVARAIVGDAESARAILRRADQFISTRNQESARLWHLEGAVLAAGMCGLALMLIWLERADFIACFGQGAFLVTVASAFGAMGGFMSVLARVGRSRLDPAAGRAMHTSEASCRIFLGAFGGAGAALLAKTGLALAPLVQGHGTTPYALLGIVAGFSERLVPAIMGRIATEAADAPEKGAAHEAGDRVP